MTTDYAAGTGCPEPYLKQIAEAGFSHVHWCHHWNDDFLYSRAEIRQIAKWLKQYNLQLNDIHTSDGQEKAWGSAREYQRLAGIELVENRIIMASDLGADVVIIHLPGGIDPSNSADPMWRVVLRSLDDLEPCARKSCVRIAIENIENVDLSLIEALLSLYDPDYVGLCYDSGHGNMVRVDEMDTLEKLKSRLIAIHLHDNDGIGDQHNLPFTGTVAWKRLTRIIAESAYTKCVNLETAYTKEEDTGIEEERQFLRRALNAGKALYGMIGEHA